MQSTDFHQLLTVDLDKISAEISAYPSAESIWQISGEIKNSAGNLALHLAGNLQHFIGAKLGNSGYIRDRDREFNASGNTKSELLQELANARQSIDAAFKSLSTADLNNIYPDDGFLKGKSIGFVLLFMSNHLNYHLGQINYHRRILAA
jgi:hypothetical protein